MATWADMAAARPEMAIRAQDDAHLGDEVCHRPDSCFEGSEASRLLGGWDRARRIDGVNHGRAGLRSASRGKTAEARGFDRPTDVPTPGCRSQSAGRSPANRPEPTIAGNKAPEATGPDRRSLM